MGDRPPASSSGCCDLGELRAWEFEAFGRPAFSLAGNGGAPAADIAADRPCACASCVASPACCPADQHRSPGSEQQGAEHIAGSSQPIPQSIIDQFSPEGERELPVGANYIKDEEHGWSYGQSDIASEEQMQQLRDLLVANKGVFAYSLKDMPGYKGAPCQFKMMPGARAWSKARPYSPLEEEIRDEKCGELSEASIIVERDTCCDFAANPTMPAKKDPEGNWTERRFCIDWRNANNQMCSDGYVPPLPEQIFGTIGGSKVFSKLDLRSGFHQIPIHEDSQHVTSFWWQRKLYQFTRLPMGIKTAVAIFQRTMDEVLQRAGLPHCACVFVDDVIVHSQTMEEHLQHLEAVLRALHEVGLRLHPSKSVFATDRVEYLGHMVTPSGLEPVAAKVAAMSQLPVPRSKEDIRRALGLLSYYRCYIPRFSSIAQPMNELLQKVVEFIWGDSQQVAFDALKAELCVPGKVLRNPRSDRPFILHTDWSTTGLGAVLGQLDDAGNEYMVACISRSLNKHERQYEAWKGELLAVVWAIKTFRVYLHGAQEFELVTDHRPLLWLLTTANPTGQQARWVLALQEFTFHIRHRPGVTNINADIASRSPLPETVDSTGARLDKESDDPYAGPLPKVVFGPVGSGDLLQPYRLADLPPDIQLLAPADIPKALQGKTPQQCVNRLAMSAVMTAAMHQQHFYSLQGHDCCAAYDTRSLEEDNVWPTAASPLADNGTPVDRIAQENLRRRATQWVQGAVAAGDISAAQLGGQAGPSDIDGRDAAAGGSQEVALCTQPVTTTYFTAAEAGIVLLELFGGIGAGLEMVLRNGTPVHTYIYVENDPAARAVAQHRIQQLRAQFPHLLPATAVARSFELLPQDVRQISSAALEQLSAQLPRQWLVVGGWPCQDLSPAGTGKGLRGTRSSLFQVLLQILGTLQQVQKRLPPAYMIENVAFQYNWKEPDISEQDFSHVCNLLGKPACLDAAQFGSYAHRLRNFWTNLCDPQQLQAAAANVSRPPGLCVQDILPAGRQASPVLQDDRPPHYVCNRAGQTLAAWPTIVAFPQSSAFLPGRQGAVWDNNVGGWSEPTADECEVAMGYSQGTTAAPSVSEQQRRAMMGNCMDANTLQAIYAIAAAWYRQQHWSKTPVQVSIQVAEQSTPSPSADQQGIAACLTSGCSLLEDAQLNVAQIVFTSLAEVSDQQAADRAVTDVWEDKQLLYYLRNRAYSPSSSQEERTRVRKRAALYKLAVDGRLFRIMADYSRKEVPRPGTRDQIIQQFHEDCGHFGVRRTAALVQTSYWWYGLLADVAAFVAKCKLCSRVRSTFNSQQPTLQPLPIEGMFYRWGCDLCGPFPKTSSGNLYCMVMIEHYSKTMECVPLPDKHAATTAAAFAQNVLGRYGSCAEVLTDQGSEWKEEFAELLFRAMIDHRWTSAGRPQTDGLAERAVQTIKRALKKLTAAKGTKDDWDKHLPWLQLGYNCSPQKSTGLSPYMLLYARVPTIPPAIRERMAEPINFDCPKAAAADYLARAELVRRNCVIAGNNLRIAQQRDSLRYARVRGGDYLPRLRRFEVGDFVWVKRAQKSTLDIRARPLILRVLEVRPSGVLLLQGRCTQTVAVHSSSCAPCHLPDIDPRMDPMLAVPGEEFPCDVCHSPGDAEYMLLCDGCGKGCHTYCAMPPLDAIPEGNWLCSDCLAQGVTVEQVEEQHREQLELEQQQQKADELSPAQQKAKQLHGRLVTKVFRDPATRRHRPFWGQLSFPAEAGRGASLRVIYEDGDSETCTVQSVRKKRIKLMPEGAQLPEGISIPGAVMQVAGSLTLYSGPMSSRLPASWDLQTRQGVERALITLMPGEYAPGHLTRIARCIRERLEGSGEKGWVPTLAEEMGPLARVVDFSGCHSFLDPFSGAGNIAAFFAAMGYRVLQNDLDPKWVGADLQADALQPAFYAAHPAQVVVTSPPFDVLDIAAPLAAAAAAAVACLHVPGHYISSATRPRQQWLHELQRQGRLHILMGLDRGPMGRKCAWLLVFATADIKKQMLRSGAGDMLTFAQV